MYERLVLYDGGNGKEKDVPRPEVPIPYNDVFIDPLHPEWETEEEDLDDLPGGLEVKIRKRPPEWHKNPSIWII